MRTMASDLAGLRAGKPFTAFGGLSATGSSYKEFDCKDLTTKLNPQPAGIIFSTGVTPLWYLCFAACAGHPALEEAEGPADFVFLRLHLRRNNVFVPLLILDPVSESTL